MKSARVVLSKDSFVHPAWADGTSQCGIGLRAFRSLVDLDDFLAVAESLPGVPRAC